jgi:PhzF family phenazine biosynthesis protein
MKIYFVDAFTNQVFRGNPAAICIVHGSLNERTMQNLASEIGFSETAFVFHISANHYQIRFFTPKMEIPLCGHATLAASKVLFETTPFEQIRFRNMENVELDIEKAGSKIKMQFPVYDTEKAEVPESMIEALGIDKVIVSRYNPENRIILIEIAGTKELQNLAPDFAALVKSYTGINGVLVTAKADSGAYDFHYRYFWPWVGTNEDPVTGAVQTFLSKYWSDKMQKKNLYAFQSSARTGMMNTEIKGNHVFIYGEAVIVIEGTHRGEFFS